MATLPPLYRPRTPGLFITGTDTGVGKTVVACLIADQWRRRSVTAAPFSKIGVLKPIATGCRRDREGLVSADAEQLAHAANFDPAIGDLDLITPIRFYEPIAPAAALARDRSRNGIDWECVDRSLRRLDELCEAIIVEGVGGVMTPIEQQTRRSRPITVLDLAGAIGYPVVVVCRANLGTLNHTAMTCELIRRAGLPLAGLALNGYDPDSPDPAIQTNRQWLQWQNDARILATLAGRTTMDGVAPRATGANWSAAAIPPDLRDAIDATDFLSLARPGRRTGED